MGIESLSIFEKMKTMAQTAHLNCEHVVIPFHWPGEYHDLLKTVRCTHAKIMDQWLSEDRMHLLLEMEEGSLLDETIKDLLLLLPDHCLPVSLDFFSFTLPEDFIKNAERFLRRQRERMIPQTFTEEMLDLLDLYEIPYREEEVADFCRCMMHSDTWQQETLSAPAAMRIA